MHQAVCPVVVLLTALAWLGTGTRAVDTARRAGAGPRRRRIRLVALVEQVS
jgi:hypothetical protein